MYCHWSDLTDSRCFGPEIVWLHFQLSKRQNFHIIARNLSLRVHPTRAKPFGFQCRSYKEFFISHITRRSRKAHMVGLEKPALMVASSEIGGRDPRKVVSLILRDPLIQYLVLWWPPTMKLFLLLFHNYNVAAFMNHNVNISYATPMKRSFNSPKWLRPIGWETLLKVSQPHPHPHPAPPSHPECLLDRWMLAQPGSSPKRVWLKTRHYKSQDRSDSFCGFLSAHLERFFSASGYGPKSTSCICFGESVTWDLFGKGSFSQPTP